MFKHSPAALAMLALSAQAFAAGNNLIAAGSPREPTQALWLPSGLCQRSTVSRSALGALADPRVGRYRDLIDSNCIG